MSAMQLSEVQRSTLENACSVAADSFAQNAKTLREMAEEESAKDGPSLDRLAQQFEKQHRETVELFALLSATDAITVKHDTSLDG